MVRAKRKRGARLVCELDSPCIVVLANVSGIFFMEEGFKQINDRKEWLALREEWLEEHGEINYDEEVRPLKYPCTVNWCKCLDDDHYDFYVNFSYH
jgi:hypothetical protein